MAHRTSHHSILVPLAAALALAACGSDDSPPGTSDGGSSDAGGGVDAGSDATFDDGGTDGALPSDGGLECGCVSGECVAFTDPAGMEQTACVCAPRYRGEACDTCAEGYTGGDCSVCAEGYFGSVADPTVCYPDPCVGDPCNGHGTCRVVADRTGVDVAACACDPGFAGDSCDACAEGHEGADCAMCSTGYSFVGLRCVAIACLDIPCGTHGTCADVDGDGTGECACDPGWSGRSCEDCLPDHILVDGACVPDVCATVDCGPGTCRAGSAGAVCACPPGYAGATCGECAPGFVPVTAGSTTTCENVLPVVGRRLTASWDAAAIGTFALEGDRVTQWNQTHGSSWLWPESTSSRPRYLLLPPAVEFDGTDDLWTAGYTLRSGDRYAIFAVVTWSTSVVGRQTILDSWYPGDGSEAYALEALDWNSVRFRHRAMGDATSDVVVSPDFDATEGKQLIIVQRAPFLSGTALTISNGTDTTAIMATRGAFTTPPAAWVGRCAPIEPSCRLRGRVHELLFYEGELSSADVDAIVAYLREKWSL